MKTSNYGKLLNTNEEVRWVQDELFCFDFIKESNGVVEIAPNGSYLEGLTLDQKYIYIYMTKSFQMPGNKAHVNTDIVVVGNSIHEQKLMGIQFTGGILGLLFWPDRLDIDLLENGEYKVKCKSDLISWKVEIDGKEYTISVSSILHENHGVSGTSLVNDQVVLEVIAADGIGIENVIPIYNTVRKMCQFLTFRKNVRFEKVELLFEDEYNNHVTNYAGATLFSRDDFETATDKAWVVCITFKMMKECLGKLFRLIYEEKENKPHFSLDFLPKDDSDVAWISPEKIKNICTALECEAMIQKLSAPENSDFRELIHSVKNVVNAHKKSNKALPDKTYDMINGSISHWDFAAADKVKALFHRYEEIVIQSRCFQESFAEFEKGIDRIITFRNRITHGNFMSISPEDANVAVNLMNLVYISRLDRLGMPRETISELIRRGVVY